MSPDLNSVFRAADYHLHLVEDVFSRMMVGGTVENLDSAEHSARLIKKVCQHQGNTGGNDLTR